MAELDDLLETSLARVKLQLRDAIVAENPLLHALRNGATYRKPTRRMRLRVWLGDHWPTLHVGPCDHSDCY